MNLPLKKHEPPGVLAAWDAAQVAGFMSPAPGLAAVVAKFTHADRLYLLAESGDRPSLPQWPSFLEMCALAHGVTNGGLAVAVVKAGSGPSAWVCTVYRARPLKASGVSTWRPLSGRDQTPEQRTAVAATSTLRRSTMTSYQHRVLQKTYDHAAALSSTLGALYVPWVRYGTPVSMTFNRREHHRRTWKCRLQLSHMNLGTGVCFDYYHQSSDWWVRAQLGPSGLAASEFLTMYGHGLNPCRFTGGSLQQSQAWIVARVAHLGNTPPGWADVRRGPDIYNVEGVQR